MEKIIKFFQNLLSLSHAESKGFIKLLIVCLAALALLYLPKYFFRNNSQVTSEDARILDSLVNVLEKKGNQRQNQQHFSFDPNILPVDSLLLLGFTKEVAERIDKYRSRGGRFHDKGDLKKIYGLSNQTYEQVYNYIDLPDSSNSKKKEGRTLSRNLNMISSNELESIPMIGKVLSMRIVRYRDLLGGFTSKDQLNEIYGLSEEAVKKLQNAVFISADFKPRLIRVNYDSLVVLKRHPYISDDLAEDIIRYRDINTIIESEKVLKNFKSVDKSNFKKLILYLDFQ